MQILPAPHMKSILGIILIIIGTLVFLWVAVDQMGDGDAINAFFNAIIGTIITLMGWKLANSED